MKNYNENVLSAADTSSQNGEQIDARNLVQASFYAYFGDATATGTFKIQASNDIAPSRNMAAIDNFVVTNWVDIPNATAAIASGAAAIILLTNMSYGWVRAVYVRSGGGSSTINVNMDVVGV